MGDRGIHGRGLDANFGLDTKDQFVENALHEGMDKDAQALLRSRAVVHALIGRMTVDGTSMGKPQNV